MHTETILACSAKGKQAKLRKVEDSGEVYYIIDGPTGSIEAHDYSEAVEIFLDEVSVIAYSLKG